jgi:hypothetical protein
MVSGFRCSQAVQPHRVSAPLPRMPSGALLGGLCRMQVSSGPGPLYQEALLPAPVDATRFVIRVGALAHSTWLATASTANRSADVRPAIALRATVLME